MRLFLSTYVNKVDRKGRVSVPASFRTVLAGQAVVAFPDFKVPAINCCTAERVEEMAALLETYPESSEEYQALAARFADMRELTADAEGRIVLSADMMAHASITEAAAFVGLTKTFQIWEPEAQKRHQRAMRELAEAKGMSLPAARTLTVPAVAGAA